ncbi:MAG: RHS repeat-associated core domain-containing protein, partial [bacterium F082]
YHSDHLGSTTHLTDDSGRVTQTLAYLPYGEDWVDISSFSYDTAQVGFYRFNGKEKDPETGFLYYGARYHWPEVWSGWLSPDPMMDVYPGISPYNYCNWNPVIFVDPDGRKIKFAPGTTREQQEQFYAAVRYLDAHDCGGRYGQLKSSDITYTIHIDLNATNCKFDRSSKSITWNPLLGLETDDGDVLSPATILNHEMTHATRYDDVRNKKLWNKLFNINGKAKATEIFNKMWIQYLNGVKYDNGESKEDTEIIYGVETRTAKKLGEIDNNKGASRKNHREGTLVSVESPTSNRKTK